MSTEARVAVIISAYNEAKLIATTVRAARAIPHVDLVLVVDDGSADETGDKARSVGAVVVRHPNNQGKSAAMETGAQVVAMRDTPGAQPRLLLFIDGDMGAAAVNAAPLVPPVREGLADCAIALLPSKPGETKPSSVVATARRGTRALTGWTPEQPTSGMRCCTREAFEAALPLSRGWGVEVGMTIDILLAGYVVVEVPCDLAWQPSEWDRGGAGLRAMILRDVIKTIGTRRAKAAAGRLLRR